MSMHKKPLTDMEAEGLEKHGMSVGRPSQLSDAFRLGVAWALAQGDKGAQPKLAVWFGSMPESNGKSNWTAMLHRVDQGFWDGITIDRSEYKDRVRYEADRIRYLIGEIPERPSIADYDGDLTEAPPLYGALFNDADIDAQIVALADKEDFLPEVCTFDDRSETFTPKPQSRALFRLGADACAVKQAANEADARRWRAYETALKRGHAPGNFRIAIEAVRGDGQLLASHYWVREHDKGFVVSGFARHWREFLYEYDGSTSEKEE